MDALNRDKLADNLTPDMREPIGARAGKPPPRKRIYGRAWFDSRARFIY